MANHDVDVVVIGSGPGGYVAAIRFSQLGFKTICVEKAELGGVCLNWGCIPSKALLKSAEYSHFLGHADDYGFDLGNVKTNFDKVIQRSRGVANQMSGGVKYLFGKYKVQQVTGHGRIADKGKVEVVNESGKVTDNIKAKHIVIATGARPRVMDGLEVDRKNILTSKEAMLQEKAPKSMIIMGAGAIGIEFGYFYNAFGTDVTIVEYADRILPVEDADVSKELLRSFKKSGIKVKTGAKVLSAKPTKTGVEIVVEVKGKKETLTADKAINAIGVQANLENIGLEKVGVKVDRGAIVIDEFMRTNVDGIYAIGDVAGAPWLAHKASAEGVALAEIIAGHRKDGIDYNNIPGCTYCVPQVASIGLTEEKAKAAGHKVKVGKFPFSANGKAHGIGKAQGFVKMIFDEKYGEVLGAHMIGPDVTEMIGEIALARSLDATASTIFKTIHAHPTLSEAIMEASAEAYGEAVNI
ncbi:MAG: dihydrolipoyl dehydrogenase [Candidatus Kapaibacteriales bacterium]